MMKLSFAIFGMFCICIAAVAEDQAGVLYTFDDVMSTGEFLANNGAIVNSEQFKDAYVTNMEDDATITATGMVATCSDLEIDDDTCVQAFQVMDMFAAGVEPAAIENCMQNQISSPMSALQDKAFVAAESMNNKHQVIYTDAGGTKYMLFGTCAWRTNNPGCVSYGGGGTKAIPNIKEQCKDQYYALYYKRNDGYNRITQSLNSDSYAGLTIYQAIQKWTSHTPQQFYMDIILPKVRKFHPNASLHATKVGDLSADAKAAFRDGIAQAEGYKSNKNGACIIK